MTLKLWRNAPNDWTVLARLKGREPLYLTNAPLDVLMRFVARWASEAP